MSDARRRVRGIILDTTGVCADNKLLWAPDLPIVYIDNPKSGSATIKHSLKQAQAAEYMRAGIALSETKRCTQGTSA